MDSEILFVFKRADPSLPDELCPVAQPFGFSLFKIQPSPFSQSYPSKVTKMGQKSLLRDTTDGMLERRPGIKFTFHWVKRKAKFFKTIKSNLCELEILLITNTKYFQSSKVKFFICT